MSSLSLWLIWVSLCPPSSVSQWLWDRLDSPPLFSAFFLRLCYSLFFLLITPSMLCNCGKRSTIARLSSAAHNRKYRLVILCFPQAVMDRVWILKQINVSEIEKPLEQQSIDLIFYWVGLILVSNQPVVSSISVTDYIIYEIRYFIYWPSWRL